MTGEEIEGPGLLSKCGDRLHWENMLIWGRCNRCEKTWPLGKDEKVFERAEKISTLRV